MQKHIRMLATAATIAVLANPTHAAGDDHGHDHGPAPSSAAPALPRFAAVSEAFELVGVVEGLRLVVYLDRYADNTPVKGATVQLEIGGAKVALAERAEGELEGTLAKALPPGVTPVTATVVAGDQTDLLAADLDIHADAPSSVAPHRDWRAYAPWIAGAAILLFVAWIMMRRRPGRPSQGVA